MEKPVEQFAEEHAPRDRSERADGAEPAESPFGLELVTAEGAAPGPAAVRRRARERIVLQDRRGGPLVGRGAVSPRYGVRELVVGVLVADCRAGCRIRLFYDGLRRRRRAFMPNAHGGQYAPAELFCLE